MDASSAVRSTMNMIGIAQALPQTSTSINSTPTGFETTSTHSMATQQAPGADAHLTKTESESAASQKLPDKESAISKAQLAGWVSTTPYAYETYSTREGPAPAWASGAAKYEWKEEFGDVGPEVPELEALLFNDKHKMEAGDAIKCLEFKVTVEGPKKITPIVHFADAGLHPVMLDNVAKSGYLRCTAVQAYAIPAVLANVDVIACAQTGSGKTAAYLVPILSKLMGKAKKLAAPRPNTAAPDYDPRIHGVRAEPLVLIVVPTRELAIQIFDEARRLCYRTMLRPSVLYGGAPMSVARNELAKGCDILIATPGRLIDFMSRPNVLSMKRVKYVLPERFNRHSFADLQPDANDDADHIYMMFSATFPKEARQLARDYMSTNHIRIRVGRAGSSHQNINQNIIYVEQGVKKHALYQLLFSQEPDRTLIFVNSKAAADTVDDFLYNLGMPSTSIHGGRTQQEREDSIRAFRTGTAPILITTDVSARGLDIKAIGHVINYDMPNADGGIHVYVHRIGRTGRIGNKGLATSFYNERDEHL
ncbi:hypothetical protein LTR66_000836, partial [Elasticomyces elasticus]